LTGDASLVILPDVNVNVNVYAFRQEAERHEHYAAWLSGLVAGDDELALHNPVLAASCNLVPDAHLGAVCRLATADRGFARFPDLDSFDPAA